MERCADDIYSTQADPRTTVTMRCSSLSLCFWPTARLSYYDMLASARSALDVDRFSSWVVCGRCVSVCVCVLGDYMITMIIHILCKSVAQLKQP